MQTITADERGHVTTGTQTYFVHWSDLLRWFSVQLDWRIIARCSVIIRHRRRGNNGPNRSAAIVGGRPGRAAAGWRRTPLTADALHSVAANAMISDRRRRSGRTCVGRVCIIKARPARTVRVCSSSCVLPGWQVGVFELRPPRWVGLLILPLRRFSKWGGWRHVVGRRSVRWHKQLGFIPAIDSMNQHTCYVTTDGIIKCTGCGWKKTYYDENCNLSQVNLMFLSFRVFRSVCLH